MPFQTAIGQKRSRRVVVESIHDHVRLLLAVEPADVDQQWLIVGEAELVAQPRIAPLRPELANLDAERHDLDRIDSQRPQFRSAAILAQREHGIEATVERVAISVADPAAQARDRLSDKPRKGPLDIDGREIGHVGSNQRRVRVAAA